MISVTEAKTLLKQQKFTLKTGGLPLREAAGMVLAEDIYAPLDIPAFDQSSMDGYAFSFADWYEHQVLRVVNEVPAGKNEQLSIAPGEAVRIFTGAALPDGADTVVMQERTEVDAGSLHMQDQALAKGNHVRLKGTEIKQGELAIMRGTHLSPAAIGFLACMGMPTVSVFLPPKVALIVTGDELRHAGETLLHGQVYEASSAMLHAAMNQIGIRDIQHVEVPDSPEAIERALTMALDSYEVVLLTGGVSVGDYDFVVPATRRCGVEQLFHRVQQRPGKPLFFGRKGNQPVFGLPGNPSSVLTCFYEYVWPLLRKLSGKEEQLVALSVPLEHQHTKTHALTHFLKAQFQDGKVDILSAQESFRLRSFATANCLVKLDETVKTYQPGELVEIHLLPTHG
ncbi:molybdopterin molybdotransferase MoeA [Parapedobacter tibetensis]|uniref:molybdopterin molybdotransferase MoeA n=1 Tax=Parapedobacter tibetensis TaxID=2972951 RepID=UPI00214D69FF|nr:gephyrin-like molybdotransferase Glp [Parapedobacter tibetensis]